MCVGKPRRMDFRMAVDFSGERWADWRDGDEGAGGRGSLRYWDWVSSCLRTSWRSVTVKEISVA